VTSRGRGGWGPPPALAAVALGVFVLGAAGCTPQRPFAWVNQLPVSPPETEPVIAIRDTILVDVRDQAALSGEFLVRDDGHYLQPTLGNVQAAGRLPKDLVLELTGRLRQVVVNPTVSVWIVRPAPIKVSVVGEVRTPGGYELTRDRSVTAALASAGWVTEFAKDDRVYVVRPAEREQRIRFRLKDLTTPEPHSARFRLRDGDVVVVE
jgi:polysaccharide export outer membrane protein